jgi:hypothetical protein
MIHRQVPRAAQVCTEEGNTIESLLGEEAELIRKQREDGGDIHEAGVIGGEHVAAARVEFLQALGAHVDEADGQQHSCPDAGDAMLRVAGAVEEGSDERHRAHDNGGEEDQGNGEEQGPEIAHRFEVMIAGGEGVGRTTLVSCKMSLSRVPDSHAR